MTRTGRATCSAPGVSLLLTLLLLLTIGPTVTIRAGPVETGEVVALTSDQVLRRVAAWLNSEEAEQRRQRQRALDSIHEQMDRMALELERLETKMDLKMDRLQEVLIGRDIKEDETSRRLEAHLIEVSGQLKRMESNFKRQQPEASDVITECASDVMPTLRRLADGVERLGRVERGRQGGNHAAEGARAPEEAAGQTERSGPGADVTQEDRDSAGPLESRAEEQEPHRHDGRRVEGVHPALRLLEAMALLEQQILFVSEQLDEGLDWLEELLGKKFGNLKNILATMTASLRSRFFERRDHLEEVAGKILRLQTAAMDSSSGGAATGDGITTPDVITAMEAAIYDIIDNDLRYMLSTKLEEAVGGQRNLTTQIGQIERDMHQGFSKLYAQLTRLSYDLLKSVQDPAMSPREGGHAEPTAQLPQLLGNISRQLHDLQLQLADQQTT